MKKGKSGILLILVVLIIALLAYVGAYGVKFTNYRVKPFSETISKGLDLVGGTSLLMEIDEDKVDSKTIDRTIELFSLRVNKDGVGEVSITPEGDKRIRIEIPGEYDTQNVLDTIGKTGNLQFVAPDGTVVITGTDVKDAAARMDEKGQYLVSLELNDTGKTKFAEATAKYLNQAISIKMDDEVISSPTVTTIINDGKASISPMESQEKANSLAGVIKSGALPVKVKAVSVKNVGPTIGGESLNLSIKAGIIGIILVMLFMILYYRGPGMIASISLVATITLILYIFALSGVVLSLSGIAGFLLTIGMAVDANVLIFERTKEELKLGKSLKTSIDAGFKRALSSIIDSNVTTIVAAVVLYYLGSGSVKGFAMTLMIGIIVSIFSAVVITKHLLNWSVNIKLINKPSHFGVKRRSENV